MTVEILNEVCYTMYDLTMVMIKLYAIKEAIMTLSHRLRFSNFVAFNLQIQSLGSCFVACLTDHRVGGIVHYCSLIG